MGDAWVESDHANENDPGVKSVTAIFNYYKTYGIKTEIMGASFRNTGQVLALSGCDLLTISPALLAELQQTMGQAPRMLDAEQAKDVAPEWRANNEVNFRTRLNENAMATEKLAEGIRLFTADAVALDKLLAKYKQELHPGI